METVQYLVPVTETLSGDLLLTAAVRVPVCDAPLRELLVAGRHARTQAHLAGFPGPGITIHVGQAVRLN